ncbi:MAG: class I SAM-dependent methyltransferase [Thermomicrobiales bacterium]|nr:class I SAM-dependent methyltransferase [Thermomicrobiales bacterium]MCO5221439.1 class I SAM-dependent methyltransferase [Thermomicrobiales bacterium]
MNARPHIDGSAGDVDYGVIGTGYAVYRQPDPRIAAQIARALGDAGTVLNVGAGSGNYEPADREVIAVEPSATMRAQRPPGSPPAIDAVAEHLPFPDGAFDAVMASSTVHQWADLAKGIAEMKRVSRGPVVVTVSDPVRLREFWLADYFPEPLDVESTRFPPIEWLVELLGPETRVEPIPIPLDCTDGFCEAYYGRPERFLEPGVQGAMSSWTLVDPPLVRRFETRLSADLASGAWDARYGYLRAQPEYDGSLRLVIRS